MSERERPGVAVNVLGTAAYLEGTVFE